MSDIERVVLGDFRLALERLVDAAAPLASWGDGNCGYVLQEVKDALRGGGLYSDPAPSSSRKSDIPQWLRTQVFERDAYRCLKCGSYKSLHADHVVAESKGGPTNLGNLQTLCAPCNLKKGVADA